jgi:hypothetical protein
MGRNFGRERVADPRPEDDNITMGEIDELEDAVDHRVAQGDQRVEAADGQGGDQCLDEVGHSGVSR